MFWGAFRLSRMRPGLFFELKNGQTVDFTVYRDQILLEPLKKFWEEAFGEVNEPIVMEDNAPVHKKVCIPVREQLGMISLRHPPNSPDLNPIENIWGHIKNIIAKDYSDISSEEEMMRIVLRLWMDFTDNQWDNLIRCMPDKMRAVVAARGGSIAS